MEPIFIAFFQCLEATPERRYSQNALKDMYSLAIAVPRFQSFKFVNERNKTVCIYNNLDLSSDRQYVLHYGKQIFFDYTGGLSTVSKGA